MTRDDLVEKIEDLVIEFFEENPNEGKISEVYKVTIGNQSYWINFDFTRE